MSDSDDEYGPPVTPSPLGDIVDAFDEPLRKVANHATKTREELDQLRWRSQRNLALVGLALLVALATLVAMYVTVSQQSDRISAVIVRLTADRERSIRDSCEQRNADHATLLALIEGTPTFEGSDRFRLEARSRFARQDCDAVVAETRRAVGVPPAP